MPEEKNILNQSAKKVQKKDTFSFLQSIERGSRSADGRPYIAFFIHAIWPFNVIYPQSENYSIETRVVMALVTYPCHRHRHRIHRQL
jgi:hypothetical protein